MRVSPTSTTWLDGKSFGGDCKHARATTTLLWPPEVNTIRCIDCGKTFPPHPDASTTTSEVT